MNNITHNLFKVILILPPIDANLVKFAVLDLNILLLRQYQVPILNGDVIKLYALFAIVCFYMSSAEIYY